MEPRFAARREQLLADAEVDPRIRAASCLAWSEAPRPVRRIAAARREQGQHARTYVAGLLSQLESKNVESIAYLHDQEHAATTAVLRPVALGRPTSGSPSWLARPGQQLGDQPRRRPRLRPLRLPRRRATLRSACSSSGAAAWASSTTARWASTSPTSAARSSTPSSMSACTCPRTGPRTRSGVPRRASPRVRRSAHAARAGPGDAGPARPGACRTPGFPVTTNWDVAPGSARSCVAAASATCWRCRRIPPCRDLIRAPTRRIAAAAASRRCPSRAWAAGARPCAETAWQTVEVRDGEKGPVAVQVAWTLGAGAGRRPGVGGGRAVGGVPGAARRWLVEARLPAVQRLYLGAPVAEFARAFKAQHRVEEVLAAGQGRSRAGGLRGCRWRGWYAPPGAGDSNWRRGS